MPHPTEEGVRFNIARSLADTLTKELDHLAARCPDDRASCDLTAASIQITEALALIGQAESHINRNPELHLAREREGVEA